MLSRSTSSSSNPLRRTKSSTSVKSFRRQGHAPPVPDSIDPETARFHALTAASVAMQRAGQRSSMESRVSSEVPPGTAIDHGGPYDLHPRTRSIRFSDESSRTASPMSRFTEHMASPSNGSNLRSESGPDNMSIPEIPGREDLGENVPFAASSYRRSRNVRRSKSMFSTRQWAAASSRGSPSGCSSAQRSEDSTGERLTRSTLRRSMSFFRSGTQQPCKQLKRVESQDAAIQLARAQFMQQQQQKSTDGAESLYSIKQRQPHKPFRKSIRSTSTASGQDQTSPDLHQDYSGLQSNSRPRLFSFSIKQGLRRLLGRSSATQDTAATSIPSQHLNAQRLHFGDYINSNASDAPYSSYLGPNDLSNRPPSIRTVKSMDTLATSNSRVSSWADSTAANTITGKQTPLGGNRLSIIQENGASYQSVPFTPSIHYGDGYSVFRKPLQSVHEGKGSTNAIDSHQVFSALRQKMDECEYDKSQEDGEVTPRATTPRLPLHKAVSSVFSHRSGKKSIRKVNSKASLKSSCRTPATRRTSPSIRSHMSVRSNYTGNAVGMTPQQVACHNENISRRSSKKTLRGTKTLLKPGTQNNPEHGKPSTPRRQTVDSADDPESVIVSRPSATEPFPLSPSIYSRTTSGGSPLQFGSQGDLGLSGSGDERGTVTILANHRLPYQSRATGSPKGGKTVKASAEWRSWMNSQMDLFNTTSPEYRFSSFTSKLEPNHYREDAQIQDEALAGQDIYTSPDFPANEHSDLGADRTGAHETASRSPLTEIRPYPQNNFSRPLRSSPAPSISISHTSVRKPTIIEEPHSTISLHASHDVNNTSRSPASSIRSRSASITPSPLMYRKPRPSDVFNSPVTPTKDPANTRRTLSPRKINGRENLSQNQDNSRKKSHAFRLNSTRVKKDKADVNDENIRKSNTDSSPRYDMTSEWSKLGDIHSTIGTKRMVDIFLSDRRRQMNTTDESTGEPVFL